MLLFYEFMPGEGGAYGLFSPFRSKRDAMTNVFKMIKRSSWSQYTTTLPKSNDCFVYDRELKRAFICTDNAVQSVSFPFSLRVDQQNCMASVFWRSLEIKADVASLVISVMNEANNSYVNLVDCVRRVANDDYQGIGADLESIVYMLSDLADMDDGYFRRDHDRDHADGLLHPIDHIDVYHSDSVSIKIGIDEQLSLETIRRMIDKEVSAFYLTESR